MKQHQKKYYGSLFAILLLIVATALVLGRVGLSSSDSWFHGIVSNDLVGMAASATSEVDRYLRDGGSYNYDFIDASNSDTSTNQEFWKISYDSNVKVYKITNMNNNAAQSYASLEEVISWIGIKAAEKQGTIKVYSSSSSESTSLIGEYNRADFIQPVANSDVGSGSGSSSGSDDVSLISTQTTKKDIALGASGVIETGVTFKADYSISGQTYSTTYDLVEIDGIYYARHSLLDGSQKTYFYTAEDGTLYRQKGDILIASSATKDSLFSVDTRSGEIIVTADNEGKKLFADAATKAKEAASQKAKQETYSSVATSLGLSAEKGAAAVQAEDEAVNSYLDKNSLEKWDYDVKTGNYYCTTCGISYNSKNALVVKTTISDAKGGTKDVYVYQEKNGLNPATYYYCETSDCEKGTLYTGNDLAQIKDKYKTAKTEAEDTEKTMQRAMNSGELTDEDGKQMKSTIRQRAYMDKLYQQQESQVVGLLSGYLNNWIDEKLGSFSRGAPAGICKYIFGIEYYKNAGWVAVPANTSSSQLQSQLIANSRTVMIEGEKEEITENLFRYAYTIRLLANQSLEWQTYLYNSCSGKTSVEQFYDYGALAPGAYFAFHYAGSGEQDMTFDCTQEDCLYDQACVAFTDGTDPVCVSLVHGAGFETPNAGNDYDCAITG